MPVIPSPEAPQRLCRTKAKRGASTTHTDPPPSSIPPSPGATHVAAPSAERPPAARRRPPGAGKRRCTERRPPAAAAPHLWGALGGTGEELHPSESRWGLPGGGNPLESQENFLPARRSAMQTASRAAGGTLMGGRRGTLMGRPVLWDAPGPTLTFKGAQQRFPGGHWPGAAQPGGTARPGGAHPAQVCGSARGYARVTRRHGSLCT